MIDALNHALDWITRVPHGDNCFVSSHYPGDPGDRCNCGKDGVMLAIENALEGIAQPSEAQTAALQEAFEVIKLAIGTLSLHGHESDAKKIAAEWRALVEKKP